MVVYTLHPSTLLLPPKTVSALEPADELANTVEAASAVLANNVTVALSNPPQA